jgi:hypothetical protein
VVVGQVAARVPMRRAICVRVRGPIAVVVHQVVFTSPILRRSTVVVCAFLRDHGPVLAVVVGQVAAWVPVPRAIRVRVQLAVAVGVMGFVGVVTGRIVGVVGVAFAARACENAALVAARAVLRDAAALRFVYALGVLLAAQALACRRHRALVARANVDTQAPVRPADGYLRKGAQQQEAQRP